VKKIILPVLFLVLITSCGKKRKIEISGDINNTGQEYIYLDKMDINIIEPLDSAKIRKNGKFRFRITSSEPDYYQLRLIEGNFITLLAEPGEKILIISGDNYLPGNYEVFGSKGSSLVKELDNRLLKTIYKTDSISTLYSESINEPGFDTIAPKLNNTYLKVIQDQRKFTIRFIIENISSLASIKALYQMLDSSTYVLYNNRDLQYMKIVADSLKVHYPDSKHTKALIADLNQGMERFNALMLTKQIQESGKETSLDIALPNPEGDTILLSSLRNNYVLLSFWTSLNETCLAENQELKKLYQTYNKKGFEIFQVSLDNDKEAWKKSILFDELTWTNVIDSEMKFAQIFNVRQLPANYLLNKEGFIIGKNLHGRTLRIKMSQLFD
jgi:peroxiredoxin